MFRLLSLLSFLVLCSSHIELGDVTPHNIGQLKKLNSVVFPITYTDKVNESLNFTDKSECYLMSSFLFPVLQKCAGTRRHGKTW